MKWFIIVVMTTQLNSGKPETPLWIPELLFDNQEECMTFARNNQIRIFNKAAIAYERKVLPTKLNCINEDMMNQIWKRENANEQDI